MGKASQTQSTRPQSSGKYNNSYRIAGSYSESNSVCRVGSFRIQQDLNLGNICPFFVPVFSTESSLLGLYLSPVLSAHLWSQL